MKYCQNCQRRIGDESEHYYVFYRVPGFAGNELLCYDCAADLGSFVQTYQDRTSPANLAILEKAVEGKALSQFELSQVRKFVVHKLRSHPGYDELREEIFGANRREIWDIVLRLAGEGYAVLEDVICMENRRERLENARQC